MMLRMVSGLMATKAAKKAMSKMVDNALEQAMRRRHPRRRAGQAAMAAVPATVLGAALMYMCDPKMGHSRRTRMVQMMRGTVPSSKDVTKKAAHIQNKSKGMAISTMHKVRPGHSGDSIVKSARSAIEKLTHDGTSLHLEIQGGRLIVSGPIDRTHVDAVRDALRSVPGVQSVEDRLDIRENDHSNN